MDRIYYFQQYSRFTEIKFSIGGQISVDVFPKGWIKLIASICRRI